MNLSSGRSALPRLLWMPAMWFFLAGCRDPGRPVVGVSMGEHASEAGRLAAEAAGGAGAPADLVVRVGGSNRAEAAISTADSLASIPGLVAVVGHANSATTLAASQIYNRARIVQIAPHSTASLYSRAGPFSFRMVSSDRRQGLFLAERLAGAYESARIAILYVNDDYGRGLRSSLLEALDPRRFPIVLQLPHVEYDVDSTLVAGTVRALKRAHPEIVVWLGRGNVLRRYLGPIRSRLGSVAVWGSDAAAQLNPGLTKGPEWEGVRYADFVYPEDTPELRAFRETCRRRFGREPEAPEVLTYDAVAVIMEGLRSGARTGPELRGFLYSLGRERPPYPGLSGPIMFQEDGDMDRGYLMREVSLGRSGS